MTCFLLTRCAGDDVDRPAGDYRYSEEGLTCSEEDPSTRSSMRSSRGSGSRNSLLSPADDVIHEINAVILGNGEPVNRSSKGRGSNIGFLGQHDDVFRECGEGLQDDAVIAGEGGTSAGSDDGSGHIAITVNGGNVNGEHDDVSTAANADISGAAHTNGTYPVALLRGIGVRRTE